jgi:prepilin-type N-terminal cleavage/methylation domain-containing protein
MTSRKVRGFSLLELMISIMVIIILASFAQLWMQPILKREHLDTAYDTTMSVLRTYRNLAITQGNRYIITFPTNQSIQVELWGYNYNQVTGTGVSQAPQLAYTYTLPSDVQFAVQAGYPGTTPDGFGNATTAVFTTYTCPITQSGNPCIVFYPDGSAQDDQGNPGDYNNSLVYLTMPSTDILNSRAVSVWGATGRVRGWRLYKEGSTYTWVQQ